MKLQELSIGNWVNYRPGWKDEETGRIVYESGTGFPVKIEMIYFCHGEGLVQYNDGQNDGIEACDYELFPIEITPEILEKNGFYYGITVNEEEVYSNVSGGIPCEYPEEGWCFDEGAGTAKIIFPNETDGGMVILDDGNDDKFLQFVFTEHLFVHQLQNALTLCGINKNIELL